MVDHVRRWFVLALLAMTAFGQDDPRGFDAHGFSLAPVEADARDGLTLRRPDDMEPLQWGLGALIEFAESPLVLVDPDTGERQRALDDLFGLNLSTSVALHSRIRVAAVLPVWLTSRGLDGNQGAAVSDLRLEGLVNVLTPDSNGLGLGVVPWIEVPTGSDAKFLGERAVAGGASVAATREWRRFTATSNIGLRFRPRVDRRNLDNADVMTAGLGGVYGVSDRAGLGLEVRGIVPLSEQGISGTGTPWEALASFRQLGSRGSLFTAGGAVALTSGAGAATYRVFLGGGFGGQVDVGPRDADGDGIVNRKDACRDEPETFNGLLDEDGCPDVVPSLAVRVELDGEPVADAEVEIVRDSEVVASFTEQPWSAEMAEGPVVVRATRGPCLSGRLDTTVSGETSAVVALEPVRDAMLRVRARDTEGNPVDARVTARAGDPACEAGALTLEDGAATAYMGPTTWSVRLEADGYEPFEQGVLLISGEDSLIEATLRRPLALEKVRVDEGAIVLLEQVHFDSGRATLRSDAGAILDEVVEVLVRKAGSIEIQGHTDDVGNADRNRELSQQRADAVRAYLVEHGIDGDRLNAVGYGEDQPATTNRTPAGRQANRRVEFLFE